MGSIPFYAKRFVSGTNLHEALKVVKILNKKNISVTLDALGENIEDKSEALHFTQEYLDILDAIAAQKLDCYVSVKLTILGLDIDQTFCIQNFEKILAKADSHQIRVAMDMEGSAYTERTIQIYEACAKKFNSPEIVIQAYLHRTQNDIQRVLHANGRVRLCKGAYKEHGSVALQKMSEIKENYKKCISQLFLNGKRVCIASHDDEIIDFCKKFIKTNHIPKERYEFQMLYGLRQKTWEKLVNEGHNMTVYVPYGEHWQAYYSRRLAERKENIWFIIKNFFKS